MITTDRQESAMNISPTRLAAVALAALAVSTRLFAHGTQDHPVKPRPYDAGKVESTPFGREGNPARVTRTLRIDMADTMRFNPAAITVRRGETVRLIASNKGQVLHELVLGTPQALQQHAELMKQHPGMEHDEPHMVHVKPGRRGEIVWQFHQAGEFQFACLLPGHFEAGMVGTVTVK